MVSSRGRRSLIPLRKRKKFKEPRNLLIPQCLLELQTWVKPKRNELCYRHGNIRITYSPSKAVSKAVCTQALEFPVVAGIRKGKEFQRQEKKL